MIIVAVIGVSVVLILAAVAYYSIEKLPIQEILLAPLDEIPDGKCPGPRILEDGICVLPEIEEDSEKMKNDLE